MSLIEASSPLLVYIYRFKSEALNSLTDKVGDGQTRLSCSNTKDNIGE